MIRNDVLCATELDEEALLIFVDFAVVHWRKSMASH